jgi:hypothetical protein
MQEKAVQKHILAPNHVISTYTFRDEDTYREFIYRHRNDSMRLVANSPPFERKIEVVVPYDSQVNQ